MKNVAALVLVSILAVTFAVLEVTCGIYIPMSIRFLTMFIVSVLMID